MAGKAAAGGGAGRDLEMQLRLRTVDEIMQVVVHFIVLFLVHISMLASTRHARASRSKLPLRPNGNSSGHQHAPIVSNIAQTHQHMQSRCAAAFRCSKKMPEPFLFLSVNAFEQEGAQSSAGSG